MSDHTHHSPINAWLALSLAIAGAGCGKDDAPSAAGPESPDAGAAPPPTVSAPQFTDVSGTCGIDFRSVEGSVEKDWVIEVNGAGVALFDYDGDGLLDVFLVNGSHLPQPYGAGLGDKPPSDALFRNLGGMKFQDVTESAGLTESSWGCGVAVGDYNNDGHPDLFVANYGPDRLWQNNGDGTFSDVTAQAGVGDPQWGSSCTFLDYDRDGNLDLFIVNYLSFDPAEVKRRGADPTCLYKGQPILCGPIGLPPAPCSLYHNRGDGTFADVSETSGIRAVNLPDATYGLGVSVCDFDNDGWQDLYVANDTCPNLLFHNLGEKAEDGGLVFVDVAVTSGVAFSDEGNAQAGMGVDAVFLGERELEDLFVVNYEDDNNTYYRNDGQSGGQSFFTEMTNPMGLARPCFKYLGWGTFFFDADLDADLDLYIAQGHVVPQADNVASSPGFRQPNRLFVNDGTGKFADLSAAAGDGLKVTKSSRGAACGDLDGDGDLDIVINDIDERATVLENVTPAAGNWLAVLTVGTRSNRDGLGAVVTLEAGGKAQRRRIRGAASYASQSEPFARFGLGSAEQVDSLQVRWPSGATERFPVDAINTVFTAIEGEGDPQPKVGAASPRSTPPRMGAGSL